MRISQMDALVFGERFHSENVIQRDRYGDGSVMIWGGIKPRQSDTWIHSQLGVVVPEVVPFLNQSQVTIFLQDNARPLTARQTQDV
jgi:hypothetical protein